MKANAEIRARLEQVRRESRVFAYQVAYELGINDVTFSRWLRREIPKERKNQIITTIEKLIKGGDSNG